MPLTIIDRGTGRTRPNTQQQAAYRQALYEWRRNMAVAREARARGIPALYPDQPTLWGIRQGKGRVSPP